MCSSNCVGPDGVHHELETSFQTLYKKTSLQNQVCSLRLGKALDRPSFVFLVDSLRL